MWVTRFGGKLQDNLRNVMAAKQLHEVIRFESFEVDVRTAELRRSGTRVKLPNQSFHILAMLLLNAGKLVTREDIRKTLWPNDTVVEFDHSINAAIKRLRQALGDSAEEPRFIETLPRRGYRFLLKVEFLDETTDQQEPTVKSAALSPHPLVPGNLVGRKISHYRVLELIGGGGMGLVYKAEDLKLGRRVALKFLPEDLARDPDSLERLEREARSASALDHPNICTIHEFGDHEGQPFLVMQFLEGQTLRERIADATTRRVKIAAAELLNVALQISEGLAAAHRKGIIHRDIKPANIFLTSRGEVKILDFGIAKLMEFADIGPHDRWLGQREAVDSNLLEEDLPPPFPSSSLTRTGTTMGTAAYMSPEQARGDRLDARTDLFSFGAMLYEMATLQPPFQGGTAAPIKNAILNHVPVRVSALNPELPPELDRIIRKALQKERENRYQHSAEMRADLEILAIAESHATNSSHSSGLNFWEMRLDERTGKPAEKPSRLTDWPAGSGFYDTSIAADSKRLAFVRYAAEGDVYISDLKGNGRQISAPVRLTLSEGWNHPVAWTSDSKAVIIESDRDGHFRIFKQYLDKDVAEPIDTGRDAVLPCVSPDGRWIFYMVFPEQVYPIGSSSAVAQLMRVSMTGGPPAKLLEAHIHDAPRCSKSPARLCAIAEPTQDRREIIFSSFDAITGRGHELKRFAADPNAEYIWDLSPDGTRIALLKMLRRGDASAFSEGPIRIISLSGQPSRELPVHGWSNFGEYIDWAPDGNGLFVSSPAPEGQALLYVDLLGNAQALWLQKRAGYSPRGVSSPDGRHLAILGRSVSSNVWMMENF